MEVVAYDKVRKVTEDLFQPLLSRQQIGLKALMKGSDFMFYSIYLLHYKYNKIDIKRGGSYKDSSDWIKSKKSNKKPINKNDNKYFQYDATDPLNYEIRKNTERIIKNKPSISEY